jgi:hypothetical protein
LNFCKLNIIIFSILCFTTQGRTQGGAQVGVAIFPHFSGARLAASTTAPPGVIAILEEREISRPSLGAGLAVQWQAERAGFRTGLQVVESGYRTVRENIPSGQEAPEGASEWQIAQRLLRLEVPAEILFMQSWNDRDRMNFTMGLSAAFGISYSEDITFYSAERLGRTRQIQDRGMFTPLQLAFQTGIGWQRDFGERIVFFMQPTFQFWYTGLLRGTPEVNRNLYTLGLKTGIVFKTKIN